MGIERLKADYPIQVRWRAFPLNPDIPESGLLLAKVVRQKELELETVTVNLRQVAKEKGLPFFVPEKLYNTRLAQELGAWAESSGKGGAFHQAVFAAYYAEGRDISDPGVLAELAEAAGLSAKAAFDQMAHRRFRRTVDRDWRLSKEKNVIAAPSFFIQENRLVGAQPYERLQRFVEANLE